MNKHLVVFAKNPRIGRVKTRLARDIGPVAAWQFYRKTLIQLLRRVDRATWTTWLAVSPDDTPKAVIAYPPGVRWLKQGGGDLGARMLRPSRILPPGPFIVIGSDIPDIQASHIRKAFALLGRNDAVFGPSEDGGFWLVGLKRHGRLVNPYRKKVRWSHPRTLDDCLTNLKGAKVALSDVLSDIDNGADLQKWHSSKKLSK